MSERSEQLRKELASLYVERMFGDEGLTLTRATKAQHEEVAKLVETMPLEPVLMEVGVVLAGLVGDAIQQQGLRPADYWRDPLVEALTNRLVKAMADSKEFKTSFQTVLRGRG